MQTFLIIPKQVNTKPNVEICHIVTAFQVCEIQASKLITKKW